MKIGIYDFIISVCPPLSIRESMEINPFLRTKSIYEFIDLIDKRSNFDSKTFFKEYINEINNIHIPYQSLSAK